MNTIVGLKAANLVAGASLACVLAGCAAANPNAKGVAGAVGGGTSTTTAASTFISPFGVAGASNARASAAPNTALVVYIPHGANIGSPVTLSPAGGFPIAVSEYIDNGANKIQVDLNANLSNGVSVTTQGVQPALQSTGPSTDAIRIAGQGYFVANAPLYMLATQGVDATGNAILTDASFGLLSIAEQSTGKEAWAAFHVGTATPANQMPVNVSATYNGQFRGIEISGPDRVSSAYSADMRLNANFANGTITGSVDRPLTVSSGIDFNGLIVGNSYQGTASFNRAGAVTDGGSVNGSFYGANATQTAGAIQVQGTPIPGNAVVGPVTIIGAYGAKR